jgi:NAD(P)-dependent dehydrogenase (short-subunit alcohol dehydrogenase family)
VTALEGRVVVLSVHDRSAREAARACAADGAAVVLLATGDDEPVAGDIAREIGDAGGRAAVFVGTLTSAGDRAALAEMLAELY